MKLATSFAISAAAFLLGSPVFAQYSYGNTYSPQPYTPQIPNYHQQYQQNIQYQQQQQNIWRQQQQINNNTRSINQMNGNNGWFQN